MFYPDDFPVVSRDVVYYEKDGKRGFLDRSGKTVDYPYDHIEGFSEGLSVVVKDSIYGYIDTTGKLVVPIQYEGAVRFSENLAAVMKDGKWGFIDHTGKLVLPIKYDAPINLPVFGPIFMNGLTVVMEGTKFGAIDKTGKFQVPARFDEIFWFEKVE